MPNRGLFNLFSVFRWWLAVGFQLTGSINQDKRSSLENSKDLIGSKKLKSLLEMFKKKLKLVPKKKKRVEETS